MESDEAQAAPEESSNSSSLTLSLTPPLSETKDETSTISEHLSSIENDRSMQEIEVALPENFALLLQDLPSEEERISQEAKPSLNSSSIVSLNGLERIIGANMDGRSHARSILEEILNNEQFRSDTEESLNIFANVDLDDKLLYGKTANFNLTSVKNDSINSYDEVCKRVKDFEELIAIKDTTIAALTSELDSYRELISNNSSLGTSTTEYKLYQEECHSKLVEYHNAIAHKDEQIEKLTSSLQQSILTREEMKQQFKAEILQLQEQLEKTSGLLREHKCNQKNSTDVDDVCSKLERELNPERIGLLEDLKMALRQRLEERREAFEQEITSLKSKIEADRAEFEAETARLRELLKRDEQVLELKQELDAKHSQEMEELRTYFEKKCADLEKNYSEEVFSQHSRKMSGSSSCSETELSSDFVFNQPGPGGDVKVDYTKKDVVKMRQTLTQLLAVMDSFTLNDLSDEDFERLKSEIGKFDVKNLLKFDLTAVRNELQNKYHAELEILREDFDNRVDIMNVEHENKMKSLEKRYLEEIEDLNSQLQGRIVTTAQQEVANSGDFEIDEVVQSYERRLQEQVTLAKIDIIAALETQIQRLAASETVDEDWPEELLRLKARFAEKYQREIGRLKSEHEEEIARLKEEHLKTLNGAVERARRRSLRDADSLGKGEMELLRERDSLRKQTLALRNLLGELLKYFTQCEDELNNTLVEELISKNVTGLEEESEESSPRDGVGKRVHLTPNFNDLLNLIDNNSPDKDLEAIDLKSELGSCLEKLKADANAILALTTNLNGRDEKTVVGVASERSLEKEVTSLTRRLISETQIKNSLLEQLNETKSIVQSLETDRSNMESQLEQVLERQKILEGDLIKAREKIAELIESGHKEIVSEGYGEDGHKAVRGLAEATAALIELQEKSRILGENPGSLDPNIMHLIDDLSRIGGKIVEEAKREKEDLKQQIEAADKKYKVTCQFLEEQAAEREQERDEAQKEIDALKDTLKERDKDRASCERITNEVENLEQQLRDMSRALEASEARCKEAEGERREAVDKIFELRDIIRHLEEQVRAKSDSEERLRGIVGELEQLVKQTATGREEEDESGRQEPIVELHRYVAELEAEVQRLRLSAELAGSEGAIQQIKNHLSDFESTLDKRTKDLEVFASTTSTTTCSSPSEDMSIRDVVQQQQQQATTAYDECEVPLQQLARLKEKLVRHSRAEDAAVKRIRDLELQMVALKSDLEESLTEREMLKRQISDHLVLISNLQIRLDEQRIRAEHIEKQTNTSLEVQNYDLKNTIASLEEMVAKRDRTIAQLKQNVEETKRRLEDREREISTSKEDELVVHMQEQLELLRGENLKLKSKLDKEAQMLPNLVENIISDKNSDIEMLKERLAETEKQLEMFASLSLDKNDIESLNRLRLSGVSFQELMDLEEVRRARNQSDSLVTSPLLAKVKNDTLFTEPEISTIEKIGPPNVFHSLQVPYQKANSTEKHVRFEDEVEESRSNQLQRELAEKNETIKDYEERLRKLEALEAKVEQLQAALEETEDNLRKATQTFEEEQKRTEEEIGKIRDELAAKHSDLLEREHEVKACRQELEEGNERARALEKELKNAQKLKNELKTTLKSRENELVSHEETLKLQNDELNKLREEIASVKHTFKEKDTKIAQMKIQVEDLSKELVHLQHLVAEKDKVIDQMGADSRSLHVNLETIQSKLQETGNVVDLGRRLREEQKKNSALHEELHALKAQLLSVGDRKSIEDIAGQVQRELDYSAYLDATLINAVGDGGSLESEDAEALKLALKKQKSINKQLVKGKEVAERRCEDSERRLEELNREMERVQFEDALLIEQLRTKLDGALDKEDRILEARKSERGELEAKLRSMKQKMSSLPDFHNEKRGLAKRIELLEEEIETLKLALKAKEESTRSELEIRDEEIRKLEAKMAAMAYNEQALKDKVAVFKAEAEAKCKELATARNFMDDIEADRRKLSRQLEGYKTKMTDTLPDRLMEKIRELNDVVKDNMKMVDLISRLTHEKTVLEERIFELEDHRAHLPFDDPIARANYLFAKYLRSESYRKALVWQKRYLISLLETYQVADVYPELEPRRRRPKRNEKRFKHVALMVVSVCRMKYLVRRWHSGKRIVQQRATTGYLEQRAQFQVGQPVSSQNFAPPKSALSPKSEMPWFGTSPPSKEAPKRHSERNIDPSVLQKRFEEATATATNPVHGGSRQDSLSREGPAMLSKYIERFNQIQERLGLDSFHH